MNNNGLNTLNQQHKKNSKNRCKRGTLFVVKQATVLERLARKASLSFILPRSKGCLSVRRRGRDGPPPWRWDNNIFFEL